MLQLFLTYLGFQRLQDNLNSIETLDCLFEGFCVFTLLTRELIPIDGRDRFQLRIYQGIEVAGRILIFEFGTDRYILTSVSQEYTIQQKGFPPTICFQLRYCLMLIYPEEGKSAKYLKKSSKKMSKWIRDSVSSATPQLDVMKMDLCPLLESIRDMNTTGMLCNYNKMVQK
jgi:hypothetical protein